MEKKKIDHDPIDDVHSDQAADDAETSHIEMEIVDDTNMDNHEVQVEEPDLEPPGVAVVGEATDGPKPELDPEHVYNEANIKREAKLWPFTLVVIGMLHVVNNLCQEVCQSLPLWKWYVRLLKPIANFLHRKDCLDRFLEKCVKGTDQEDYEEVGPLLSKS